MPAEAPPRGRRHSISVVRAARSCCLGSMRSVVGFRAAGRGYDVVIDASGSAAARQTAFDFCRPGGQVVLLGMGTQRSEVNFVTSIRKEHRVAMSFAYTPVDFRRSLDLLIAGEIDLTPWTVRMPLARGQEALERVSHDPGVALKMMLEVAAL